MLKLLLIASAFLSIQSIYAQEKNNSTHSLNKSGYNHESNKLNLEFVVASEQVKSSRTHEVNGQYTSFKTSLLYSMTEQDEVRLYNSFVKENYDDYDDRSYFELAEIMYRRKSILNSHEHWVNLDFEMKHAIVLDKDQRRRWGFSSETIPQINIKKRLPNSSGVELKLRHHFFHRNRNNASAIAHEDRIYLSAYKMFAQKFIFNTEVKYRHQIYTGPHYSWQRGGSEGKNHEDVVIHPGLLYLIGNHALIEGYVETKLNETFDERDMKTLAKDELVIGAALYLSVF